MWRSKYHWFCFFWGFFRSESWYCYSRNSDEVKKILILRKCLLICTMKPFFSGVHISDLWWLRYMSHERCIIQYIWTLDTSKQIDKQHVYVKVWNTERVWVGTADSLRFAQWLIENVLISFNQTIDKYYISK